MPDDTFLLLRLQNGLTTNAYRILGKRQPVSMTDYDTAELIGGYCCRSCADRARRQLSAQARNGTEKPRDPHQDGRVIKVYFDGYPPREMRVNEPLQVSELSSPVNDDQVPDG